MFKNENFRRQVFTDHFHYLEDEDTFLFPRPRPEFRFVVIGTGMIGMEHIRITLLEGRAMIHGLFDPNPKSILASTKLLERIQPNAEPKVYETLEQACLDPSADAILICTPNFTHLNVLKSAIASKKPIFLEKPMATTIADAYEIYRIAQDYANFIQVGLQYRYKAMYKASYAEALERRSIGNIKTMAITEHRLPFLDKVGQWNKFSELSGGTLVEKCCHYFDLFNYFAQSRPAEVWATGSRAVNFKDFEYKGRKSDIIDNAFVNIRYQNDIRANFNLCMFSPMFYEDLTLCGDEGRIACSESEDFLPGAKLKTRFEMKCSNARPAVEAELKYPTIISESGHNGSTYFEHVDFIENIKGNPSRSATPQEGLWSIIVGEAAEESLRRGRAVKIDEFLAEQWIDVEKI